MPFWIVTDACCDLPEEYIHSHKNLKVVPMLYQADDEAKLLDLESKDAAKETKAFYAKMRAGAVTKTSSVNEASWIEHVEPLLAEGNDVLILAFSSGLSITAAQAAQAAETLKKKYPDRKIRSVDSLSASLGEGLFVHRVLEKRDEGLPFDECAEWAEKNVQNTIHWFTVEDLVYLKRGGRISAASYYAASIMKIKPVLNVDPNGHLVGREKVVGRRRSVKALLSRMEEFADDPQNQTVFIGHGDCLEDAEWLKEKIQSEIGVRDVMISLIGPVIGAHSGPGTLALFFRDKNGEGRLEAE
ncbi:MAG: DegV family protein [Clostridiales bacterium]|nr:DegV family protein [Clostridiales bacterium]